MAVNLINSNDIQVTQTGENIELELVNQIPTIDSTVSTTSTNGIENQAITNYVKDINVYSTNEVDTGKTWIDGKPIYRKVVDCGLLPNNTFKDVSHNISNLDEIININGIINYNNGFYNLFPLYKTSSIAYIDYISTSIFKIKTTQSEGNANLKLIVEYTKTS